MLLYGEAAALACPLRPLLRTSVTTAIGKCPQRGDMKAALEVVVVEGRPGAVTSGVAPAVQMERTCPAVPGEVISICALGVTSTLIRDGSALLLCVPGLCMRRTDRGKRGKGKGADHGAECWQ
jgi:hypothetical protein